MQKNKLIKEKKEESIIAGAINVFIKKGFDNATIDEIAHEIGIGKGTIYRKIGNKEKLEEFIIKQIAVFIFGKIENKIKKTNDPILQFKEIINIMCDFFDEKPETAMLFYSRIFFNPQHPNYQKSWPPIKGFKTNNLIESILEKAIKEKKVKEINIPAFIKGFTFFCNPFYFVFLKKTLKLSKSEISVLISNTILDGVRVK